MFAMENKVTNFLGKFFKQLKEVRHELVGHLQSSAHLFPVLSPKKQVLVNGNSGLQVTILNATDSSSILDSLHSLLLPKVLHKMLFAGNKDFARSYLMTHRDSVSYIAHTYHCTMDDKCMYIL